VPRKQGQHPSEKIDPSSFLPPGGIIIHDPEDIQETSIAQAYKSGWRQDNCGSNTAMSIKESVSSVNDSRRRRALVALPILAFSLVMCRAMMMTGPIYPVFGSIYRSSRFNWNGLEVPILTTFYGIPIIDQMFSPITIIFAQLQFFTDPRSYWQSLVFVTDYAGMYTLFILESCRQSSKGTVFRL
jgi:hypothetical protein